MNGGEAVKSVPLRVGTSGGSMNGGEGGAMQIGVLMMIFAGAFFYFLPSFIAHRRDHNNATAIILINTFFGWTIVGWFASLIWAVANPPDRCA